MKNKKSKIIAHYLPQFHTIPENDKWWGSNFTEWVNVKKSKPLFNGHSQPNLPLDNNFYDLSKIENIRFQSELAEKYNIYGFCFYHYWFNGKLLLEKPIELFIKDNNIKSKFCFSWANEKWTRAWDGLNSEVLIDQNYGSELDWERHFNHLLPYFNDQRYIRIKNKPLFIIYRSMDIDDLQNLKELWNSLALKNGFEGVHLVCTLNGFERDNRDEIFDSYMYFEPLNSLKHGLSKRSKLSFLVKSYLNNNILDKKWPSFLPKYKFIFNTVSYKEIWNNILSQPLNKNGKEIFPGGFVQWDNTPRKKNRSTIINYNDETEFKEYFEKLYQKALENNSEFVFVNAWNEWAEGAYMEPDSKNGFKTLEIIRDITSSSD